MTLKIGRVSIAEAPSAVTHSGDGLDLSVTVGRATTGGSATVGKMTRLQLLGLAGNDDEEVVPFTSTDDPDLDGYYRVLGVSCDPFPVFLANGAMQVQVSLERVANGWRLPVHELVSSAAVRTNVVGVTDGEPDSIIGWHAAGASAYDLTGTTIVRDTSGSDSIAAYTAAASWAPTSQQVFIPPASFYDACCLIEVQASDGNWYPVIGRQAPANMAGKWRIGNGLFRVSASATNVGDLKLEVFSGNTSNWEPMATEFRYGRHTAGAFSASILSQAGFGTGFDGVDMVWTEPHIIRNDRDTCVIGFRRALGHYQTFTIHAADYFVEFYTSRPTALGSVQHAIQARSSWSSANLSIVVPFSGVPGIQSAADDADGHRILLAHTDTTHARYASAPSGIYQSAAAQQASFCIGVVYQGSTAATGNTGVDVLEQWMAAKAWRTFAVAQ